MKKKYKMLALIYFIIVGIVLFKYDDVGQVATTTLEYIKCGSATGIPRPVPQLTTIAYTMILVGAPLVFIAFSIITLVKAVASGKDEEISKAKGILIKKIIITALIYLSAGLIQFVLLKVVSNKDDKSSLLGCMSCFLYYSESNCEPSGTGNDISTSNYRVSNEHHSTGSGASNKTSNGNQGTPAPSTNAILVGDSRTVGICKYSGSTLYSGSACRDYIAVAQVGMGQSWFTSTAVPVVDKFVSNNKYNIIILMGTNDVGVTAGVEKTAVNTYTNTIKNKISGVWSDDTIIFVSVLPVGPTIGGGMSISQAQIDSFNNQMKTNISSINSSNVKYCDIVTGVDYSKDISNDGVHYTASGYEHVYEQIKQKCLK